MYVLCPSRLFVTPSFKESDLTPTQTFHGVGGLKEVRVGEDTFDHHTCTSPQTHGGRRIRQPVKRDDNPGVENQLTWDQIILTDRMINKSELSPILFRVYQKLLLKNHLSKSDERQSGKDLLIIILPIHPVFILYDLFTSRPFVVFNI